MQMPTSVRIGPLDYTIAPMEPMEGTKFGNFGWFHHYSQTISYRNDVAPQQKAHILMHEMLHGIWYAADIAADDDNRDVEERYVTRLAQPLCDLIRNNPELIAWMSQTLAGPGEPVLHAVSEPTKTAAGMSDDELKALADKKLVYVNDKPTLWA